MSLLFNMLPRLVITFLPRHKCLLISWLQSPSAVIVEPPKIKSDTISPVSPSICHDVMGADDMILLFWMLSFKPTFSLSSFTFFKRLFSSSSLSVIRVVSSAYLRLLIFLLAILIPAYASFSPAFLMMYSAYKLNKQGDNIQSWHTPFPIWNQSVVLCPVLTVASEATVRTGTHINPWIFSGWSNRRKTLSLGILDQWKYALSILPFLRREMFSLHYCKENMPSMSLQGATVSVLQGCLLYVVWDEG